ncbi:peroxide stress protein YaaA [Bradyrhizobium sp. 180]|uniref:peroxide stress protein YaaA n=1 Tax=Bradyrhizobium sp. 180 TaxID=2782650 RepID=UPI001FFAC140|nr:peroxide stress protein YaaA [Bradyrhizobium sp. 180]MCK1491292.1 peroxide stress protein YaaA [Bradyrhizobium sp. 180]
MTGLVLFLHGMFGDETSWQAVPDFVAKSLGNDFEIANREYSAGKLTAATLEASAEQIVTFLATKYPDAAPIYLVGHSFGGLVAREVCRKLLVEGPDDTLQRIKAVITAGTPLEGVPYGNWLLRGLRSLNPKLAALANPDHLYSRYRLAIREAQKRKVNRPKLFHLVLEDDRVVAQHIKDNFTDDDEAAGVLPGTHTGFAKGRQNAEYVADVLVSTFRRAQNADSVKPPTSDIVSVVAPLESKSQSRPPDRLILIACSHAKRDGGGPYSGQPLRWVPETSIRQDLLAKRNYIYSVLQDGKLVDNFERGGNRSHQPANAKLVHGLDLGGVATSAGEYLPACERYSGRIYGRITNEGWESYFQNGSRVKVLIMSGLYGLIEPDEFIQNYDIHLSDTHKDYGLDVKSQWLELYTKALTSYVRHAWSGGRRVRILNLLCDHHYVDAIRWHSLPREACEVFHFTSSMSSDVALLPPAGTLIDSILKSPDILESFDRDHYDRYSLTDYGQPPAGLADFKFGFESRVGLSSPRSASA